jgi:hypothetical protein
MQASHTDSTQKSREIKQWQLLVGKPPSGAMGFPRIGNGGDNKDHCFDVGTSNANGNERKRSRHRASEERPLEAVQGTNLYGTD